jgi:hypothetical protein
LVKFDLEEFKLQLIDWQKQANVGCIYFIKNLINGKYYVGQTTKHIITRVNQHIKTGHKNSLIHAAIKKYGVDNFEYGKLYLSNKSIEELNKNEIETILLFDSLVPNGYNQLLGGLNHKGRIPWNKNKKGSQKAWNKGIPNLAAAKEVIGTNIQTGIEIHFRSAKEAERLQNFHNSWIIQCCKGKQKQHKGYTWRYK